MSQNPHDGGYFTNLLNSNAQQYGGSSNPSTPSSTNSNPSPQEIMLNQQYQFQQGFANYPNRFPSPQFFSPLQSPQFFNPSQSPQLPQMESQPTGSQFKVPKAREPAKGRGKKSKAKKTAVDLDRDDDEDVEVIAQVNRRKWTKSEEMLLAQCWIEISQDKDMGNDRPEEHFWNDILEMFNSQTTEDQRGKNMISGKWTRINGDCQKFNAIYKHLQRRSGENDQDHVENAKVSFMQRFGGREFLYEKCWDVLKNYPKWDAEDPIDVTCLEDIFGPDKRPRPERDVCKRAGKKQKSTSTSSAASSGGSQTSSFSGHISEIYAQKADAQRACYEARREKEKTWQEKIEMDFLMIDPSTNPDPVKAEIIRKRQERLVNKYHQIMDD